MAMLVDRERVAAVLYRLARARVVKAEFLGVLKGEQASGNAERPDRVPDAEKLDLRLRVALGLVFRLESFGRVRTIRAIIRPGVGKVAELLALKDAAGVDE